MSLVNLWNQTFLVFLIITQKFLENIFVVIYLVLRNIFYFDIIFFVIHQVLQEMNSFYEMEMFY